MVKEDNKIGRFLWTKMNNVGGYPCYYLEGNVFNEIDKILMRIGKQVYSDNDEEGADEKISIYHLDNSTIRISYHGEAVNETNLSIFGSIKSTQVTLKKLEEAFT